MYLGCYCISLQQSTYIRDLFWVAAQAQPKYEYPLSPGDLFAERVLFWVLLLEKTKNGY
jgi:hypothetical protein